MLTPTHHAIIQFIRTYTLTNGYPPTLQDIGDAVGMSKTAVHYHVKRLCEWGVLSRRGNSPRSLVVREDIG